ncbi:hypothetical protein AgCh_031649 [Apium graveolens]
MIGRSSVTVEVYNSTGDEYQIEGSIAQRCCTIFDGAKSPMAEIKRKVDYTSETVFGKEVFSLFLKPGFDAAFAMALVLVLDQINADDGSDDDTGSDLDTTGQD